MSRWVRVVGESVDGWPREDPRSDARLRSLGFKPVDEGPETLPLSCAACFEAIFYGFDYDRDADTVVRRLLTVTEARRRLTEWLYHALSTRQCVQQVELEGTRRTIALTAVTWLDLISGVLMKTPTLVYSHGELLELSPEQAVRVVRAAKLDYLRAAQTVQRIAAKARDASLDDLVELTSTLDAELPWVAFTRN